MNVGGYILYCNAESWLWEATYRIAMRNAGCWRILHWNAEFSHIRAFADEATRPNHRFFLWTAGELIARLAVSFTLDYVLPIARYCASGWFYTVHLINQSIYMVLHCAFY